MADPFSTLGLPADYSLDLGLAEQRHRELSRTLHPDRYVGRPSTERRQALGKAIEVNDAWRVLRDPVRRAEAVLEMKGIPFGEDREPRAQADFLMEVMEQREELAELRSARDLPALAALIRRTRTKEAALVAELSQLLGDLDTEEQRERALRKLGELRYSRRFLEEAADAEDALSSD